MLTPIPTRDLAWLHMDRPNNLMYVHGVMWFEGEPDWHAVEQVLVERLVERFPVFHRRAVERDGTWLWEDDEDFALANHVRRVTLAAPAGTDAARQYISGRLSDPFDHDRPLWEVDFISGVVGDQGGTGSILLCRFHHVIADGVRLVQVMLSMCDLDPTALPAAVGKDKSRRMGVGQVAASAGRTAMQAVQGAADVALGMPKLVVSNLSPAALEQGLVTVRDFSRATDAVTDLAPVDNAVINTVRSVSRVALAGRSVDTVWSGPPGVAKGVGWITGIDLESVKAVGRQHGGTVNDVLLAAVSKGLTRYLGEHGEEDVDLVRFALPVSLKPMDANLPKELGNHFGVVLLPMPLGIDDTDRLLATVNERMMRIKGSAEPIIIYGVQKLGGYLPPALSTGLTHFVANKTLGVLTNVPGPRAPMSLAGTEVRGVLGWVPTTGDQSLGVCIFSYNGEVNIGLAGDEGLFPNIQHLADLILAAFEEMRDEQ
jgi:WS/DGAT/MGAT family acyltransferase